VRQHQGEHAARGAAIGSIAGEISRGCAWAQADRWRVGAPLRERTLWYGSCAAGISGSTMTAWARRGPRWRGVRMSTIAAGRLRGWVRGRRSRRIRSICHGRWLH